MRRLIIIGLIGVFAMAGAHAFQAASRLAYLRDGPDLASTKDLQLREEPLADAILDTPAGVVEQGVVLEQPPAPAGPVVRMSGEDGLALAERLFDAEEFDQAGVILTELAKAPSPQVDHMQVRFLLGMIAVSQEDYETAVETFRTILDEQPDLVRVRLELARALFALKQDQAARYHFRLALAADLPEEAQMNIKMFLAAIEQRKIWRVSANVGVAPDSNISAGPKDQQVELFGLPFELDDNARERSGLGFSSTLIGEVFPKIARDWRAELRGGASISDYEHRRFDDVFLFAEAGPRFQKKSISISALGAFSRRFFGGNGYSTSTGGKLAVAKGLTSRTVLRFRFSGAHVRYDVDVSRTGPVYSAGLSADYAIDNRSTAQMSLTATRELTRAQTLRNTQYIVSASYRRELPFGLTVQLGPDVYYRDFDSFDPINQNIRSDWTYGGSIFVTKRDWRLFGFAPVISYQYLNNNSNADRFDYSRHRANIGLTKTF